MKTIIAILALLTLAASPIPKKDLPDLIGTPFLGVAVQAEPNNGVTITETMYGFPAHNAGMLPYDTITKVNDTTINDLDELLTALRKCRPGTTVQIEIRRLGNKKIMPTTLTTIRKDKPKPKENDNE
jgi:S1-C subfamily serine protease